MNIRWILAKGYNCSAVCYTLSLVVLGTYEITKLVLAHL